MEYLQELSVEEWPESLEKLKRSRPSNVVACNLLKLSYKYPYIRNKFQLEVFCPHGQVDLGFVAVERVKGEPSQFIVISPVCQDTTKLEEALQKTNSINWKEKNLIMILPPQMENITIEILDRKSAKIIERALMTIYMIDKSREPFHDLRCPENVFLAPITEKHVHQINTVWPHKFEGSEKFFSVIMNTNLGFGLFSEHDDALVAWLFIGYFGHLHHLYCEETHRKKGYAEYLMKYVVNDQLRNGNDIYGLVLQGNYRSAGLFKKLGFDDIGVTNYWTVKNE